MATTFAAMGLLGLWATISRWPWYVRSAVVLAGLAPTLLRPAPELFVTLAIQAVVVVAGVAAYRVWAALRGKYRIVVPRIDLRSLLAAMGLMGALAALLKVIWKSAPVETYVYSVALGLIAAATTLLAAWWTAAERSWKWRIAALFLLFPIVGALCYFDFFFAAAPLLTFWPYSIENWYGPFPQLVGALCLLGFATAFVLLQVAFVALWRSVWGEMQNNRVTLSIATISLTALLAALPIYVLAKLQFPVPIPQELQFAGDDDAFQELLALAVKFKKTALWLEICRDQPDREKLQLGVRQQSQEFEQLHGLLSRSIRRPLSVEWVADAVSPAPSAAWRAQMDELSQLRTCCYVLDVEASCARRAGDVNAAIQSGLALIQLGETVCRGVDFSTRLSSDNFIEMGLHEIYRSQAALDADQCERCIRRIDGMLQRRPPVSQLIRYYRANSENGYGWSGHLQCILGDLAECVDPTLDARHEKFLTKLDFRHRVAARLMILELLLRKFYLRHGVYPQSLDELASLKPATGLSWLHVAGEPIVYRPVDDDGYLLYSYGNDGDDDGGRAPTANSYGTPDNLFGDGDIQLQTHFAEPEISGENNS